MTLQQSGFMTHDIQTAHDTAVPNNWNYNGPVAEELEIDKVETYIGEESYMENICRMLLTQQ